MPHVKIYKQLMDRVLRENMKKILQAFFMPTKEQKN